MVRILVALVLVLGAAQAFTSSPIVGSTRYVRLFILERRWVPGRLCSHTTIFFYRPRRQKRHLHPLRSSASVPRATIVRPVALLNSSSSSDDATRRKESSTFTAVLRRRSRGGRQEHFVSKVRSYLNKKKTPASNTCLFDNPTTVNPIQ
jgi:hypothetical protein